MLGGAGTKKNFLLKILNGACMKKLFLNSLASFGRAGTKMLNSRKMLDGNDIEKASLTQNVRRDWREKPLFTENARRGWYKKPVNLIS